MPQFERIGRGFHQHAKAIEGTVRVSRLRPGQKRDSRRAIGQVVTDGARADERGREGEPLPYDVVGPICETGDTFSRDRLLPPLEPGDLVAFRTAGAYGATLSNEYNARPQVPEALVRGDEWSVVRRRPTYEEMRAREPLADWL